jgi:hypothetical protein
LNLQPEEGPTNREEWIENRIEELAEIFAVGIGGFSVMDNHLHLLLTLDPDVAQSWFLGGQEEVISPEPPPSSEPEPLPPPEPPTAKTRSCFSGR